MNHSLCDGEFRSCYRVSRTSFQRLLTSLCAFLSKYNEEEYQEELEEHLNGGAIEAATKLEAFLCLISGASYWDVMLTYGLARSTVYSIFEDIISACDNVLEFEGLSTKADIKIYRRRALDLDVSREAMNPLPGCVGALDGTLIFGQKQTKELNNQQFYTRKGGFGVPVQALVDAKYRFISSSAVCVGSTADRMALAHSNIGRSLEQEGLPKGFWIACDEAYGCSNFIVTPISRSMASRYQDGFNFCLLSERVHVEQASGRLKGRWGILWRPFQFDLQKTLVIVNTAMRLPNYCISSGDSGDVSCSAGNVFESEARECLERWLAWSTNGHDFYFDPFEDENFTGDSFLSEASVGFADNYSNTRVRLCRIIEKFKFVRPCLG